MEAVATDTSATAALMAAIETRSDDSYNGDVDNMNGNREDDSSIQQQEPQDFQGVVT